MQTNNEFYLVENKSVFPVVSVERKINYSWDKEKFQYLDKRVQPLTVADCKALISAGYSLPSVVNEGSILIRHPYRPRTIIDANMDGTQYIQEKFSDYAAVLNYLGATKQELKAQLTKLETRQISANGIIKSKGKFSIKGLFKRLKKESCEIKYTEEIRGTSIREYQKAYDYAEQNGLANDPFVKKILALQKDKPIMSCKCSLVFSKDYTDIMDAAATLSVLSEKFGLDGNFKKVMRSREEYSINQDLTFIDICDNCDNNRSL